MPLGVPLAPASYGRPPQPASGGGANANGGFGTTSYGPPPPASRNTIGPPSPHLPISADSPYRTNQTRTSPTPMDPYIALMRQMGIGNLGDQQMTNAEFNTQRQLAGGYRDLGVGQLQQQYGFDMGKLGEQQYRNVDLKRGEQIRIKQNLDAQLAADNENFQALGGFANRELTDTLDYLNQQGGFNQQELSQALAYLAQQAGFAQTDLGITKGYNEEQRGFSARGQQGANERASLRHSSEKRGARNQAASQGSTLSEGAMARSKELDQQLGMDYSESQLKREGEFAGLGASDRRAELGYNTAIAGINDQGSTARLGYDRGAASLANQGKGAQLGYDKTMQGIDYAAGNTQRDYDKQVGEVKDNNLMLDSLAREYGISRAEMGASLRNGIERLGLDYNQTLSTIRQSQTSSDAQFRAAGLALQQQALSYANSPVSVGPAPAASSSARTGSSAPPLNSQQRALATSMGLNPDLATGQLLTQATRSGGTTLNAQQRSLAASLGLDPNLATPQLLAHATGSG